MLRRVPKKCDVIVIGGEPAGTIAAGILARDGCDVVLLEQKLFPRNTVVESLIPHFWKFTDMIDASTAIAQEGFLVKKGGDKLDACFEIYAHQIPVIGELLKSSQVLENAVLSIRNYAYRSKKLAFNNCYIAGDAAAFVDPISTKGVPMAMYGGYLAAWAISNSLKKSNRKDFFQRLFIQEYDKRLQIFKLLAYPGNQLPAELLGAGKKILKTFGEREIRLIRAQAKLTGRLTNLDELLGDLLISGKITEVGEL
jgi:flavin-dependent dehydrogenase